MPPSDPVHYVPTTMPGARLPSTFLSDGSALFDRLGPWFTLVNFGGVDATPFVAAAERANIPLSVLSLQEPELERVYGRDAFSSGPISTSPGADRRRRHGDAAKVLAPRVVGPTEQAVASQNEKSRLAYSRRAS